LGDFLQRVEVGDELWVVLRERLGCCRGERALKQD
jgi:hypothetical protein